MSRARSDAANSPLTLNAIYPPPSSTTFEQYERAMHRDLPELSRVELLREYERLKFRLLVEDDPAGWFIERHSRLERAIAYATRRRT